MHTSFSREVSNFLREEFSLETRDTSYLESALTHPSFSIGKNLKVENYERLEFLGDSLIGFIVTEQLFNTNLPLKLIATWKKQIIQGPSLTYICRKLNFNKVIRAGNSLERITDAILENVLEAFVGAAYLTFGFEIIRDWIITNIWGTYLRGELSFAFDYKTLLQEMVHHCFRDRVSYSHRGNEKGLFQSSVMWGGDEKGWGSGTRLKEAEQCAARDALSRNFNHVV